MSPEAQEKKESNMCLHRKEKIRNKKNKCQTADLGRMFIGRLGSNSRACDRYLLLK
jgi:hypothetical protein